MGVPTDRKYTKDHEWAKLEGGKVRVGITDFAQRELGDVVFIEVPAVGKVFKQGEGLSSVESVKAVSDIYAPVSGSVVEVNSNLSANPDLINSSPFDDAWIAIIEPSQVNELDALMDAQSYDALIG